MSHLTVHNAVVKGHHAYRYNVVVGDIYGCKCEFDNAHDPAAVAVYSSDLQLVGHIPAGFCSALFRLLNRFTSKLQVFW